MNQVEKAAQFAALHVKGAPLLRLLGAALATAPYYSYPYPYGSPYAYGYAPPPAYGYGYAPY